MPDQMPRRRGAHAWDGLVRGNGAPVTAPIQMLSVDRRFGDHQVIDHLSLAVEQGIIYGFVGPSGSGKTTTVRLLTGVLAPTRGTVLVFGTNPKRLTTRQRERIGYMPQLGVLYPHLSVRDNLAFTASLYGIGRSRRRIREVLEMVELTDARSTKLRDASGGMQRRVALAGALLHRPDLLFLDEPTSGLDPVLRQKLWEHLQRLRDEGETLFLTTQIVSEATMCDRVGLIAHGRLLADGTPDDLRRLAFGGEVVDLRCADLVDAVTLEELRRHPAVSEVRRADSDGRVLRVTVDDAESAGPALTEALHQRGVDVRLAERYQAPFDDVFVALLERRP